MVELVPQPPAPSPPQVLIIAWDRVCLAPIFGETALGRLVRLAAAEGSAVTVWLTPEVNEVLPRRPFEGGSAVSWRVLPLSQLPAACAALCPDPAEILFVLPGHSVWDRRTLRAALAGADPKGPGARFRLRAAEVAAALENWRLPGLPPTPASPDLPVLLGDPADSSLAEGRLVAALAAATQGSDGVLARWLDRPLSRRLSPKLAARRVAPNLITLCGTAIGCLGAWLLAQGGYPASLLGAALFLVAVILDGVDGEVARLTLRESRFGHYLDIITDNLVHLAVFCGIALGVHRGAPDARHLYALAFLLLGFALSALAVYRVVERPPGERLSPLMARTVWALNSRDFAYLVFLLALADRLVWFLWAAAVGSNLFAAALFLLSRHGGNRPAAGG